jgi:hypothetical protein
MPTPPVPERLRLHAIADALASRMRREVAYTYPAGRVDWFGPTVERWLFLVGGSEGTFAISGDAHDDPVPLETLDAWLADWQTTRRRRKDGR